jgi:hypothetical protein
MEFDQHHPVCAYLVASQLLTSSRIHPSSAEEGNFARLPIHSHLDRPRRHPIISNIIRSMRRASMVLSLLILSLLTACTGNRLEPARRTFRGVDSVLDSGSKWELIGRGYQLTADSAVDNAGMVYFTDAQKKPNSENRSCGENFRLEGRHR